jgi:hypothetical protein
LPPTIFNIVVVVVKTLVDMPPAESEAEHVATVLNPLYQNANQTQPSFWISRKRKRGRTQPSTQSLNFPHLLDGEEPDAARDLRRETFTRLWSVQERAIQVLNISRRC